MIDAFQIESALEALFMGEASDKKFKAIDLQRDLGSLTRPGMAWAATGGKFSVENGMAEELYENFDIICLLGVKNVASERERRREIHAAVRHVVLKLMGSTLDLPLEDLQPSAWKEVTTADDMRDGVLVVKLNYTARAKVDPAQSGEAERRLDSIWTTYTDPADGQPLAESQANFEHGDTP